ncbi:peptidase M23 [Brevirhabdus pacifica]|uniref:Peptidase M23 n=2 Tax=Brevirhabdus pacifica TaxID=1267768 RepID=A0A1U7DM59_9RHOB|nr:peptidoglycan DD-metalloendopeptidase family protein [Brevirhabdus pacifica]APX91096.1 peptidase M23 [Brevirhabdus pacifica]
MASGQADPAITAQRAAQMLERAAIALTEAEGARDRVRALSEAVRGYEEGLIALREGLRQATLRERVLVMRLDAKREEVARLLGALQTIQRAPAPLLLLHPSGPVGTARSGMILSEITPALQSQARTLGAELSELQVLRLLQESAAATLSEGLDGAQKARIALSRAVADRTDLPRRFAADPAALARLAESSQTLDSFADGLSRQEVTALESGAGEAEAPDRFAGARGRLPLPVDGKLLRRFEEADAAGVRRPGIVLATRPRALVTSPWPATIRYRGPLLDYGNVMILEPAADFLLVIAGLKEVYGEVGEIIPAGAPIGLMGGEAPEERDFLTVGVKDDGGSREETLYMEVRQANVPMDPADWFRLTEE